jgi:hypothetical protein
MRDRDRAMAQFRTLLGQAERLDTRCRSDLMKLVLSLALILLIATFAMALRSAVSGVARIMHRELEYRSWREARSDPSAGSNPRPDKPDKTEAGLYEAIDDFRITVSNGIIFSAVAAVVFLLTYASIAFYLMQRDRRLQLEFADRVRSLEPAVAVNANLSELDRLEIELRLKRFGIGKHA